MHDRAKIIGGLIVFLALALIPFWTSVGRGEVAKPKPKIVTQEKYCVLDTEVMRASHMDLLNEWRDAVVREGRRTTVDSHGRTVEMSLSRGCMSCHTNKQEFCDACHNYLAVAPYCWDCHVEPPRRT